MIQIIKNIPLFKYLTLSELEEIAPLFSLATYKPNEVIVWQGDLSDKLYIIQEGIVAVKAIQHGGEKEINLAYLLQGDTIGEMGVLDNTPRSATIVSVNNVEVIYVEREAFLGLLNRFSSIAIELARTLSRYLMNLTSRLKHSEEKIKTLLLFHANAAGIQSNFGYFLISTLATLTSKKSVYLNYPLLDSETTPNSNNPTIPHPNGYDILLKKIIQSHDIETPVLFDKLTNSYFNIVINIESLDKGVPFLIENAKEVIILTDSSPLSVQNLENLKKYISRYINLSQASIYTIHVEDVKDPSATENSGFDFTLKTCSEIYQRDYCFDKYKIPEPIVKITEILVDRLEKNRQLSIYIPTTMNVNQNIDTSHYIQKSMEMFGSKFGGATSKIADGVWNSAESGLVNEKVHIIRTFSSSESINLYLNDVIEFVKELKVNLKQEAMAIELDNKMFIV